MMANVNSQVQEGKLLPARAITSVDAIVAAARRVLEADGLAAVTMQRVAGEVGVRPPSLYKRIRDHADLMHRLSTEIATELADKLDAAATGDPERDIQALAATFRDWAHNNPESFTLLTALVPDAWRADQSVNGRTGGAILHAVQPLVGDDDALDAARTLVAFVTGFVSLELAGGFRMGGDPSTAYRYGIDALTRAMHTPTHD